MAETLYGLYEESKAKKTEEIVHYATFLLRQACMHGYRTVELVLDKRVMLKEYNLPNLIQQRLEIYYPHDIFRVWAIAEDTIFIAVKAQNKNVEAVGSKVIIGE